MTTILKIAWRSLWRNKKRTLITTASVFFAVLLALAMRSMQLGSYDNMVKNAVSFYSGYLQVQKTGYWEDKSINKTFEYSKSLETKINSQAGINLVTPRLESFALASSGNYTKGTAVIGTNPVLEAKFTHLNNKLIRGKYLVPGDDGLLLGSQLADFLKVDVGDSLILYGQGYHGVTAAGEYPVKGIIKFPSPQMDKQTVYMSLQAAQYFYGATDMLSSLPMMIDNPADLEKLDIDLQKKLGMDYHVMTWKELMPDLLQEIQADNAGGIFMLGILYMIIAFGILGTIMMMTIERRKEFAVMVAVGMRKTKLALMILFETLIMGLMGIISGVLIGFPFNLYFHLNPIHLVGKAAEAMEQFNVEPIMPFSIEPGYIINQALVVIIMTLVAYIFPLIYILRFSVIKGMKN
jgi:ABC-type lipoprotein release transport system permease subunit